MRVAARLFTAVSRRRVQEATTLNNLGALYRDTQRLKESADAYAEALQIRRDPAKTNPQAYLPFCRQHAEQSVHSVPAHAAAGGIPTPTPRPCRSAATWRRPIRKLICRMWPRR